jgi:hypothetical protein
MNEGEYMLHKIRSRCTEDAGCLIWPGATSKNGLPQVHYQGKTWYVRKLIKELTTGVPEDHVVIAVCETPKCVAEDCLKSMTLKASRQIGSKNGAYSNPTRYMKMAATKRAKSKYSEEQIEAIRSAESLQIAVELTGVSQSYCQSIRKGVARKCFANPFSGLFTL